MQVIRESIAKQKMLEIIDPSKYWKLDQRQLLDMDSCQLSSYRVFVV